MYGLQRGYNGFLAANGSELRSGLHGGLQAINRIWLCPFLFCPVVFAARMIAALTMCFASAGNVIKLRRSDSILRWLYLKWSLKTLKNALRLCSKTSFQRLLNLMTLRYSAGIWLPYVICKSWGFCSALSCRQFWSSLDTVFLRWRVTQQAWPGTIILPSDPKWFIPDFHFIPDNPGLD